MYGLYTKKTIMSFFYSQSSMTWTDKGQCKEFDSLVICDIIESAETNVWTCKHEMKTGLVPK